MNSQGLNFNLTIFNCLIAVTMLELLGMLRRSHYSISTSRGYKFPIILHFKGLSQSEYSMRNSSDADVSKRKQNMKKWKIQWILCLELNE